MDFLTYVRAQWDRSLGYLLVALGGVALLIGWAGVHDSLYMGQQMPYIVSGGLGGLFLLGLGVGFLVTAELRDEWRKLDRIQQVLDRPCGHGCHHGADTVTGESAVAGGSVRNEAGGGASVMGTGAAATAFGSWPALIIPGSVPLIGGILLATAWWQSAGTLEADPGVRHLRLGAVAVVLCGIGVAGLTLQIRRRIRNRLVAMFLPALLTDVQATLASGDVRRPPVAPDATGTVWIVEHGRWYHHSGCACLASSPAVAIPMDQLPARFQPCQLCDGEGAG